MKSNEKSRFFKKNKKIFCLKIILLVLSSVSASPPQFQNENLQPFGDFLNLTLGDQPVHELHPT